MNYKPFTPYIEQSILQIETDYEEENEALAFLRNPEHFRSFSEGLILLMERNGYPANANELFHRMQAIGSRVNYNTVENWFLATQRPKLVSNSRTLMYQLCFALSLPINEVKWFFHHVYYDRCFNCHIPEEAIYYFCFSRGLSYHTTCTLLNQVTSILETATTITDLQTITEHNKAKPISDEPNSKAAQDYTAPSYTHIYTVTIRNQIDQFKTTDELIVYFKQNSFIFMNLHTSALEQIHLMLAEIKGTPESIEIVKKMRDHKCYKEADIRNCGLVIQELYHRASHPLTELYMEDKKFTSSQTHPVATSEITRYMQDSISKYKIDSVDFILNNILCTTKGIHKAADVPELIKVNFPSKKLLSDILKRKCTASYHAIRKVLIMLHFYIFWCKQLLQPVADFTVEQHLAVYRDEANAMLTQCCYEELYAGNPYDWVFLTCACSENPLDTFRELVGEMTE